MFPVCAAFVPRLQTNAMPNVGQRIVVCNVVSSKIHYSLEYMDDLYTKLHQNTQMKITCEGFTIQVYRNKKEGSTHFDRFIKLKGPSLPERYREKKLSSETVREYLSAFKRHDYFEVTEVSDDTFTARCQFKSPHIKDSEYTVCLKSSQYYDGSSYYDKDLVYWIHNECEEIYFVNQIVVNVSAYRYVADVDMLAKRVLLTDENSDVVGWFSLSEISPVAYKVYYEEKLSMFRLCIHDAENKYYPLAEFSFETLVKIKDFLVNKSLLLLLDIDSDKYTSLANDIEKFIGQKSGKQNEQSRSIREPQYVSLDRAIEKAEQSVLRANEKLVLGVQSKLHELNEESIKRGKCLTLEDMQKNMRDAHSEIMGQSSAHEDAKLERLRNYKRRLQDLHNEIKTELEDLTDDEQQS